MPIRRLLEREAGTQDERFLEAAPDKLKSERETVRCRSTGEQEIFASVSDYIGVACARRRRSSSVVSPVPSGFQPGGMNR